jgi:hypothetical protein
MKNTKIKISVLALVILSSIGIYSYAAAFSFEKNISERSYRITDSTISKTYTCPMHPEVISDKPGQCPKCGMDLELNENSDKSENKSDVKNDKDMDHKNMEHKGCNGCMHKH